MTTAVGYLAVLCVLGQSSGAPRSLESLVVAHESALGLVREIELQIDISAERFKPKRVQLTRLATWFWARKGSLERTRWVDYNLVARADGLTNNRGDVFRDGSTSKWLRNWDPAKPQTLTPQNRGSVRAEMSVQTREVDGKDAMWVLLWAYVMPGGTNERFSLADLVAQSSPPAVVKGRVRIAGRDCWHIRAFRPGPDGKASNDNRLDFFLDPAVNYAVRMLDVEQTISRQGNKRDRTAYIHIVGEVREFRDCGGGVYVPSRIESRLYDKGDDKNPASVHYCVVTNIVVNQPLSKDAFAFVFPPYVQVVHNPPVNGRSKVELWGPGNKPIKEIESLADLEDAMPEGQIPPGASLFTRVALGCVGFGLVALCVVLLVRFGRARGQATGGKT